MTLLDSNIDCGVDHRNTHCAVIMNEEHSSVNVMQRMPTVHNMLLCSPSTGVLSFTCVRWVFSWVVARKSRDMHRRVVLRNTGDENRSS